VSRKFVDKSESFMIPLAANLEMDSTMIRKYIGFPKLGEVALKLRNIFHRFWPKLDLFFQCS
jgi:hypothetical protein